MPQGTPGASDSTGKRRTRSTNPKPRAQYESDAAHKRRRALELRAKRVTYAKIAQELGYANRGGAYRAVQQELKSIPREAAKELREIELESLDAAERALGVRISQGDLGAIDRMIKIKDMRAKLTGLYETPADTGVDEVRAVLSAFMGSVRAADAAGELEEDEDVTHE